MAGAALLIALTALHGDGWQIASSIVYGLALVTLYTASTLYHSFRRERVKKALRVFDHCSIYLLIAGSYTPFALVSLRGDWGWALFGLVWGLAVAGIVFKVFFTGRLNALSTAVYVLMGWLAVVAAKPIVEAVPPGAIWLLLAGGVIYTTGTVFYHNRRVPTLTPSGTSSLSAAASSTTWRSRTMCYSPAPDPPPNRLVHFTL